MRRSGRAPGSRARETREPLALGDGGPKQKSHTDCVRCVCALPKLFECVCVWQEQMENTERVQNHDIPLRVLGIHIPGAFAAFCCIYWGQCAFLSVPLLCTEFCDVLGLDRVLGGVHFFSFMLLLGCAIAPIELTARIGLVGALCLELQRIFAWLRLFGMTLPTLFLRALRQSGFAQRGNVTLRLPPHIVAPEYRTIVFSWEEGIAFPPVPPLTEKKLDEIAPVFGVAPVAPHEEKNGEKDGGAQCQECSICTEHLVGACRRLPCKHAFHAPCVDNWILRRSANCPNCRAPVQ